MAATGVTAFANGLKEEWAPGFAEAANEERVVTRKWMNGTGVQRMGKKMWIRKIEAPGGGNVQTLSGTASARADQLSTYQLTPPSPVFVTPTYYYICPELSPALKTQLGPEDGEMKAAYRRQFMKALMTKIDTVGAAQIQSLSNVVGGAVNVDASLLAAVVQAIAISAKDKFKIGVTKPMLTLTSTQIGAIIQVPNLVQAQIRGEPGAIKTGWVSDAYNLQIEESGNVYVSAGLAHNPVLLSECQVLAYNEEPNIWDPVQDGMATLLPASMEFGVSELWDEYGIDMKTNG